MHIHPSWWKCFTNRTDPSANAIFEFIGFGRSAVLSKTLFVLKMIGDFLFVWKISQKFGRRIVGILTNNHNFVHRPINCPWYKIWHPLFLMFPYSSVITFKLVRDMTLKKYKNVIPEILKFPLMDGYNLAKNPWSSEYF